MCGRYASFRQAEALADAFDVDEITEAAATVRPSFNIAPTQIVRIVVDRPVGAAGDPELKDPGGEDAEATVLRELHAARWGLVPPWAPDVSVGAKLINARSETVAEKRSFAPSLRTRRCVVPADGYYEWRSRPRGKVPYFIHHADAAQLAFAGLYAFWRDPAADPDSPNRWLLTATILTRPARDELAAIHDREPVILPADAIDEWLDPAQQDPRTALGALSQPGPDLTFHEVSAKVNRAAEDHAELIEPARR